MPNLNKVFLMGNLTRDVESRFTPSGVCVGSTGLAVNRKFKDAKTNALRDEVTFVDLTAFGKTAESIAKHWKKGTSVWIEGRLKFEQWDDKQTGAKRSKLGVVVDSWQFTSGKPQAAKAGNPQDNTGDLGQDLDEPAF